MFEETTDMPWLDLIFLFEAVLMKTFELWWKTREKKLHNDLIIIC